MKINMYVVFATVFLLSEVTWIACVKLDLIDCGVDPAPTILVGNVAITDYPWLGILYYINDGEAGEMRAVTTVALIHTMFVIGVAADIGPMPKHDFRKNSRVLLGETWNGDERRVANYVLHPEYGVTMNTLALVQLKDPVLLTKDVKIRPLCPPPDFIRNPDFYVVKFKDDFNNLQKEVVPVLHIPGDLCKDFYVVAKLYEKNMRPPHVTCVTAADDSKVCVWLAGAALVSRDGWGRWMLLGLGVRGPGCGAPSRYLDMMSYLPWVEDSLARFSRVTITQLHKQKYVLRAGEQYRATQRFGACDAEEKTNLIYRELIKLWTCNNQYQFLSYNLTIIDSVEYTCLTLELVNASAVSEMRIKHHCPRDFGGPPCHYFKGSSFDISVYIMFSDQCRFEMYAWGHRKDTILLDIHEHKLEEGTYYEDFSLTKVEYKGSPDETGYGFEPLDEAMWKPDYDLWVITTYNPNTTTTKRPPPVNFLNSDEEPDDDDSPTVGGPPPSTVTPGPDAQPGGFTFGIGNSDLLYLNESITGPDFVSTGTDNKKHHALSPYG